MVELATAIKHPSCRHAISCSFAAKLQLQRSTDYQPCYSRAMPLGLVGKKQLLHSWLELLLLLLLSCDCTFSKAASAVRLFSQWQILHTVCSQHVTGSNS
jgi:hypothetical protein